MIVLNFEGSLTSKLYDASSQSISDDFNQLGTHDVTPTYCLTHGGLRNMLSMAASTIVDD